MRKSCKFLAVLLSAALCACLLTGYACGTQIESYKRNKNGETYGSGMLTSENRVLPDLILAEGDSGVIGYVRRCELQKSADTLPTVLAEMAEGKRNTIYTIPVYSENGITIIDTFTIGERSLGSSDNATRSGWVASDPWTNANENYRGTFTAYIKSGLFKVTGKAHISAHQAMNAGGLGAQVFIFNEEGVIVSSSAMVYSHQALTEFSTTHSYNGEAGVRYYAQGSLRLWNEELNTYWTFGTYSTPYATPSIA